MTHTVAGKSFDWQGRLTRFEGRGINQKTRTVPCRVLVAEPKRVDATHGPPALMRGMHVTVTLTATPKTRLLKIPTRAMQPNNEVWTVEQGRTLRVHDVEPVKVLPDGVLLRADDTQLEAGDHLVVSQLLTAFDGMQIREATAAGSRSP